MAWNTGVFSRLYNWVADRDGGIKIRADRMDGEFDNFKTGLNDLTLGSVQWLGGFRGYDGTVLLPGYSFSGDLNTGMYRIGADNIGFSVGGVQALAIAAATLTSTWVDAGAGGGPIFDLFRDSASPAANDVIGAVSFNGRDSAANKELYASIQGVITDPTSTSEDSDLVFYNKIAGALTEAFRVTANTGVGRVDFTSNIYIDSTANARLTLDKATGTDVAAISGKVAGVDAWVLSLGNASGDAGWARYSEGVFQESTLYLTAAGVVQLQNGQLNFPATQNASTNANTLDDYEEGTWTPTLTFITPGNLAVTYSTRVGTYIKVGKLVVLLFEIQTSAFTHSTASGSLVVDGVPFTAASNGMATTGKCAWSGITKASYTEIEAQVGSGGSLVAFVASGSGVTASAVIAANMPTGGSVILRGSISFQAAA